MGGSSVPIFHIASLQSMHYIMTDSPKIHAEMWHTNCESYTEMFSYTEALRRSST